MPGKSNFNKKNCVPFLKPSHFCAISGPCSHFFLLGEGLQPLFSTPWPSFPIQLLPAGHMFNLKEALISKQLLATERLITSEASILYDQNGVLENVGPPLYIVSV
jgi:hypothetical protein